MNNINFDYTQFTVAIFHKVWAKYLNRVLVEFSDFKLNWFQNSHVDV